MTLLFLGAAFVAGFGLGYMEGYVAARRARPTHQHQWVPWSEIYHLSGDKVFSNGRGCRVCRIRERA